MKNLRVTFRRWRARRLLAKVSPLLGDYNEAMIRAGVPRHERKRRIRSLVKGDVTFNEVLGEMVAR